MVSSRPQRQAKVTRSYREEDFFAGLEPEFSCPTTTTTTTRSRDQPRRSLALRRGSVERATAKERAEAVHLERAIKESLGHSKRKGRRKSNSTSVSLDISDSEDEPAALFPGNHAAFQCLLDVASEEQNTRMVPQYCEGETKTFAKDNVGPKEASRIEDTIDEEGTGDVGKHLRQTTVVGCTGKRKRSPLNKESSINGLNSVQEEDKDKEDDSGEEEEETEEEDWSCDREDADSSDSDEDCSGGDSDVTDCVKNWPKKPKLREEQRESGLSKNLNSGENKVFQVKKPRSSRRPFGTRILPLPEANKAQMFDSTHQEVKENAINGCINVSTSSETNMALGISKLSTSSKVYALKNCATSKKTIKGPDTASQGLEGGSIANLCTSVGAILTSSTPTIHRRVIGLSKRFRPPPLHPYLNRSCS